LKKECRGLKRGKKKRRERAELPIPIEKGEMGGEGTGRIPEGEGKKGALYRRGMWGGNLKSS